MDTNSNSYTIFFSVILVIVVGIILSVASVSLKPRQDANKRMEKMQSILKTIDIKVDRHNAEKFFNTYIKEQFTIDVNGEKTNAIAFEIDLSKELRKDLADQNLPIYIAYKEDKKYYIIPLHGKGLWDEIWGYISLEEDKNTVFGVTFDHAGETPGLGAEITQKYFQDRFKNEKIFSLTGAFKGITVKKGNNDLEGKDKEDNEVDALAGATITGDGVTKMLTRRLKLYTPYFNNN